MKFFKLGSSWYIANPTVLNEKQVYTVQNKFGGVDVMIVDLSKTIIDHKTKETLYLYSFVNDDSKQKNSDDSCMGGGCGYTDADGCGYDYKDDDDALYYSTQF